MQAIPDTGLLPVAQAAPEPQPISTGRYSTLIAAALVRGQQGPRAIAP